MVYRGVVRDQKIHLFPCSLLEHVIGNVQRNSNLVHIVPAVEHQPDPILIRFISKFRRGDLLEQGNHF